MNKSDVHEYWRNPDSDKFGASKKYRSICQPEHYIDQPEVSKMWLDVFNKFVEPEASILELGCSVGRNLFYLTNHGYKNLLGVEINPRVKQIALVAFGEYISNLIHIGSIENYILTAHDFSVVFTSGVLMHIHPDSEWVFKLIAETAYRFLMIAEVEEPTGLYKWPRNYQAIFEALGLTQIHEQEATPMSNRTILRVFKKVV